MKKRITIGTLHANDDPQDELITLYAALITDDDGDTGYQLEASNGDDVGYFAPQSLEKVRQDMHGMWDRWDTFEEATDENRLDEAREWIANTYSEYADESIQLIDGSATNFVHIRNQDQNALRQDEVDYGFAGKWIVADENDSIAAYVGERW